MNAITGMAIAMAIVGTNVPYGSVYWIITTILTLSLAVVGAIAEKKNK